MATLAINQKKENAFLFNYGIFSHYTIRLHHMHVSTKFEAKWLKSMITVA